MNRPRFTPPTADPRAMQNLFTQPPPNFIPPAISSESDYKLPQNIPSLLTLQVYPHNQQKMKSFCKTCAIWTVEPYDCHINSENHMVNKTKEKYEPIDDSNQFSQNENYSNNKLNNPQNPLSQPVNRFNGQSYDNNYISPMYIPKKAIKRNANMNDQIRPISQNIVNKFNENVNVNGDDSQYQKIIKNRRPKVNIPQQNQQNSYENTFHPADSQSYNNNIQTNLTDVLKIGETSIENNTQITGNIGRELLLPISGVFCTLCEEFFRNTDSAETIHCESVKHLTSYEKLQREFKDLSDNKSLHDCNDNMQLIKRSKDSSHFIKNSGTHSYSPITREVIANGDNDNTEISVGSTRENMESDQNSYNEFQGPDFSLDFPEETEDYDE